MPTPTLVLRAQSFSPQFVTTPYITDGSAVAEDLAVYGYSVQEPIPGPDGVQCSDNEFKVFNDYFVNSILFGTLFKTLFFDPVPAVLVFEQDFVLPLTSSPA